MLAFVRSDTWCLDAYMDWEIGMGQWETSFSFK